MRLRMLPLCLSIVLLLGCQDLVLQKETLPPEGNALTLLDNNGNCRLPCIWGLTPGATTTGERQRILAPYVAVSSPEFSISASDPSENPGGFGISIVKDDVTISVGLNYYETDHLVEILSLVAATQQNDRYVFGNSHYSNLLSYYTLPSLLSEYGVPGEVLVISFPPDPFLKADYEPFSLVVIYADLGIMAEYISPAQRVGDKSLGCPHQSYLALRTWDVKKNISLKEIASVAAGDGISNTAYDYFKPIQQATPLSVEDFYNTFKTPGNSNCIEVPSNLWKP